MGWESEAELRRIATALESIAKSLEREAVPGPPLRTIAWSLAQFVKDYENAMATDPDVEHLGRVERHR